MLSSTQQASPPEEHTIEPRPIRFNITDASPRYWFANDPFRTQFFNALFTTFPPGENFFVRSVVHYRDRIRDPLLLKQINAGRVEPEAIVSSVRLVVRESCGAGRNTKRMSA